MLNHLGIFYFFFCFFFSFFFLRLMLGQRRAVVIIGRWLLPSLVDTGDICCHYWQPILVCTGNSPVPGEFPAQRPVTRIFDVFVDLRPNKRLSKQSWGWWSETSSSLWRHRNVSSAHNDNEVVNVTTFLFRCISAPFISHITAINQTMIWEVGGLLTHSLPWNLGVAF